MLLLWYHYVIFYADVTRIILLQRSPQRIVVMLIPEPLKDDDSPSRMGGLLRSKIQKVQIIHKLEFSYASFVLSLCYRLCGFYTDYALKKKSSKKLCYVTTTLLCLFHAMMMWWFTIYIMILWGNIVVLLLYFHMEAYFQRTRSFIGFFKNTDMLFYVYDDLGSIKFIL